MLERLAHRGASGAEVETGDGAGILVQMPHRFLAAATSAAGFELPEAGGLRGGDDLPARRRGRRRSRLGTTVEQLAGEEGLGVLGWRVVPTEPAGLGKTAPGAMPRIEQVFLAPTGGAAGDLMALERQAFVLRKRAEHAVDGLYFPSLSARTLVYKGMLTSEQLRQFFSDLRDPLVRVGRWRWCTPRFSTNTFPQLAAGPPVPVPGPQRGDQHAGRQPELDAGPRGAARDRR